MSRRASGRMLVETGIILGFVALALCGCETTSPRAPQPSANSIVGQIGKNRYYTPANQILTPAGVQVELPGLRPQALALSPNGKLLVTAGKTHEIVVVEPRSGKILQRVPLPAETDKEPAPNAVSEKILAPD